MERLIKPALNGGAPYLNQDFFNTLQNNNLLSYKSFLDRINDSTGFGNSGIIIKGVINVTPSGTSGFCYFDFTDSMIYLNGDYLEPVISLSTESNRLITATKFYLVKSATYEKREAKTSGFMTDFIEKAYFDVEITKPTTGSYIEIVMENGVNMCSRYLNRVLRYHLAEFGQLQMTIDGTYFDNTGLGKGDMFGFAICNQQNGTINLNKKFLIGYTQSAPGNIVLQNLNSLPVTIRPEKTNYDKLQNIGGLDTVPLEGDNIPSHNHGGYTGKSTNKLRHSHELQIGQFSNQTPTNYGKYYGKSKKIDPTIRYYINNKPVYGSYRKNPTLSSYATYVQPVNYEALRDTATNLWDHSLSTRLVNSANDPREPSPTLNNHTHRTTNTSVTPTYHNNLPPYVNVIYYEKINPYQ